MGVQGFLDATDEWLSAFNRTAAHTSRCNLPAGSKLASSNGNSYTRSCAPSAVVRIQGLTSGSLRLLHEQHLTKGDCPNQVLWFT